MIEAHARVTNDLSIFQTLTRIHIYILIPR